MEARIRLSDGLAGGLFSPPERLRCFWLNGHFFYSERSRRGIGMWLLLGSSRER